MALPLLKPNLNRENLFLDRYGSLREQAMRLANHNATEAEDLLHDAFIYFTLSQTPIEEIQNLDGYLYIMLRNLRLAQERRRVRISQNHISLVDYESAELALNSIDPRDTIKAQDELRWICRYASIRRHTSKAGSVLILRFLHGYFPNEISQILKSPRSAVDNLLQTARREVKAFRQNPEALTFLNSPETTDVPNFSFGQVSPDILSEVRKAVFMTSGSDCPTPETKALYTPGEESLITAKALAHLATCRICLDSVNEMLGLPSLASRLFATEEGSKDDKPKTGGGSGGGMGVDSADAFLKRSRKRRDQIFEHRPEELFIAVNGFIVGAHRVNSELSELALSVGVDERLGFIEVFSESDVRLLFQSVEAPPDGVAVQSSVVGLSDGRQLELSLDFRDTRPQLYAKYADPTFREGREISESRLGSADRPDDGRPIHVPFEDAITNADSLFDRIRAWFEPMRIAVTAAVLAVAVLGVWYLNQSPKPEPLVARTILKQARDVEFALAPTAEKVLHRNYQIEEWANSSLRSRRRIDEWQKPAETARRTYDEQGRMIAGQWGKENGSRQIFEQGQRLRTLPKGQTDVKLDSLPMIEPTVNAFANLLDQHGVTSRVVINETSSAYTLSYEDRAGETEQRGVPNRLLVASLTLDRAKMLPTTQTLILQIGDELREYRYSDVRVEQKPVSEVSPLIFQADAELVKGATTVTKPLEIELPQLASIPSPVVVPNTNPGTATLDTEVEVFRALDGINALSGEQINVTRTTTGSLKVVGLVDSGDRKTEVMNALNALRNAPGVVIDIQTREEAAKRSKQNVTSDNISIQSVSAATNSDLPVEAELKDHFAKRGLTGEALNAEIRQYAGAVLNRSRQLRRNALALKSLAERFSPAELEKLEPAKRDQWTSLLRSKAATVAGDVRSLSSQMSGVGLDAGGDGVPGASAIRDASDLAQAAQRLFGLAAACDAQVSQSFSISGVGKGSAPVKTVQFWRNLRQMADIAAEMQKF